MDNRRTFSPPFPFQTRLRASLTGCWTKGGAAVLVAGGRKCVLPLPRCLFAVFASLFLAALKDQGGHSLAPGFVSVDDLAAQIKTVNGSSLTREREPDVIKYVFRLRTKISNVLCRDWGYRLVEHVSPFGYRLSTPPDHLLLDRALWPQQR